MPRRILLLDDLAAALHRLYRAQERLPADGCMTMPVDGTVPEQGDAR